MAKPKKAPHAKLKTKSAAKKRFRLNASGLVSMSQARKNHFRRRRSNTNVRDLRGTTIMKDCDAKRIVKHFLPNG
jgi:large subunit ribosomal protein L35